MDGLLIINKPEDWTSFDVVKKIRNKFGAKKVGHTGTLDPKATGVLVLCIGKATKLVEHLTVADKEYVAEVTLGATSTTDDVEGEIAEQKVETEPSKEQVQEALMNFVGEFDQLPPDFSAKKKGGQKAYQAARKGKPLKLEPSRVTVYEIQLLGYSYPTATLRIKCGKGFYVRALARDLGKALGTGGYLTGLQRTEVGEYTLAHAKEIEKATEEDIIPLNQLAGTLPPTLRVKLKI